MTLQSLKIVNLIDREVHVSLLTLNTIGLQTSRAGHAGTSGIKSVRSQLYCYAKNRPGAEGA